MFFFVFHKTQSKRVQAETKEEKDRKTRTIEREKLTPCGFV